MDTIQIGLDEALVSVQKLAGSDPIQVYSQSDECYGCDLELVKTIVEPSEQFKLATKQTLQLQLRNKSTGELVCVLQHLALNDHGHYSIDLRPIHAKNATWSTGAGACPLTTLDKGNCMMCPIAVLFAIVVLVLVLENIFNRYLGPYGRGLRRKLETSNRQSQSDQQLNKQGQATDGSSAPEADGDHDEQAPSPEVPSSADTESGPTIATNNITNDASQPARRSILRQRVESLDAFRGLTIMAMIAVNYGGAGYVLLEHKAWNGLTPADLVFPFFIFSMGSSIAISTKSLLQSNNKHIGAILIKILRRSLVLMLLGLCLNSRPLEARVGLDKLRLTGVLQRFSISYLVVGSMYAFELTIGGWLRSRSIYRAGWLANVFETCYEIITALNCVTVYLYVTFLLEYDTYCPAGYLGPGGATDGGQYANCTGGAAAWLDRLVLGESHLYHDHEVKSIFKTQVTHDPEGLLGYSTSILLTIIGLQAGKLLSTTSSNYHHTQQHQHMTAKTRTVRLFQWSAICALASAIALVVPINKRLWSVTFVSVSGACAFALLALLYICIDICQFRQNLLSKMIVSAGKNSIFLYVGHSVVGPMLPWLFAVDETSHLQLLVRLGWSVLVWLVISHYMAHKRLFIKV